MRFLTDAGIGSNGQMEIALFSEGRGHRFEACRMRGRSGGDVAYHSDARQAIRLARWTKIPGNGAEGLATPTAELGRHGNLRFIYAMHNPADLRDPAVHFLEAACGYLAINFHTGISGDPAVSQATSPLPPAATGDANPRMPEADFIRFALDNAAIVAITDVKGNITFVNSKFCEISGYSREELLHKNHRIIRSGQHDTEFFRSMYREISNGHVWNGELCNRRKNGELYWVDTTIVPHRNSSGKVDGYTSIRFDISSRRRAEESLQKVARIDDLTGLPNRRYFRQQLDDVLDHPAGKPVHLALLDIDLFKEINDAFGHDIGDALLKEVGARLEQLVSPGVFIARLGGDEFGVILQGMSGDVVRETLSRFRQGMREPFKLGVNLRRCSASIGLASFPDDGETADQLFKAADLALYRAKALGRDQVKRFTPALREAAERKAELHNALEAGLGSRQITLHYQPVVSTRSGAEPSLEALLRWHHPDHGILAPGAFLSGVHDPGLLSEIGLFVVERAFQDMHALIARGTPVNRIAINVTNADFSSAAFIDHFFQLSSSLGVPPSRFTVEVTEGVFLGRDYRHVETHLARLSEADVEIALDDFGTGYASLTHLRRMPIDRIKIDKSFVSTFTENKADEAIVRGIIEIAHSMGKRVTAEGVETQEQVDLLCSLGCDHLQGWYFSKAKSLEQLTSGFLNSQVMPRRESVM